MIGERERRQWRVFRGEQGFDFWGGVGDAE